MSADGANTEDRVLVRALRPVRVDGRALAVGEQATMRREDAGLAVLAGRVAVLGRAADRLRIVANGTWALRSERAEQAAQTRSAWMADGDPPSRRPC